jgi:anti-sigma B factor antagonist
MELQAKAYTLQVNVIQISGRLEAFTVPQLRAEQEVLLAAEQRHFIVDLSQATFMDSAGMSALVSLLKRSRQAGGNVVLVKPTDPAAYRILTLTRFDQVFTMVNTVDDGLKQFHF